ncbi:hypothetical protein D3C78_1740760 [compost metagenome]
MIKTEHVHIAELRQPIDTDRSTAPEGHLAFPGIWDPVTIEHFLEQTVFTKHQHMPRVE